MAAVGGVGALSVKGPGAWGCRRDCGLVCWQSSGSNCAPKAASDDTSRDIEAPGRTRASAGELLLAGERDVSRAAAPTRAATPSRSCLPTLGRDAGDEADAGLLASGVLGWGDNAVGLGDVG